MFADCMKIAHALILDNNEISVHGTGIPEEKVAEW
jgi:hypothetical protein